MKLGHIELFVRDPAASLRFYRDVLGCELVHDGGGDNIWVKLDTTEFLLRRGGGAAPAGRYRDAAAALVLYCEGLDRTMAGLASRGLAFRGDDGSSKEPVFTDPDGHWFQLVDCADRG